MFSGVYTAIVTPFRDGQVDHAALAALVERQVKGGVAGVVPCGTTGESATLSEKEKQAVIGTTVEAVAGRCQVIAGVGSNDTAASAALARAAREMGADGGMVVMPYYNKPGQEGMYHHVRAIAEATPDWPILLYNVPGRTGVSLAPETVSRLADLPGVVAIKDATCDMEYAGRVAVLCGDRMTLLSGQDGAALPLWAIGGRGVVSVASNLVPARMVELWKAFDGGDLTRARALHLELVPLFGGLFIETNPGPIKHLVARHTGLCSGDLRLPMVPVNATTAARLKAICAALDIALDHDG